MLSGSGYISHLLELSQLVKIELLNFQGPCGWCGRATRRHCSRGERVRGGRGDTDRGLVQAAARTRHRISEQRSTNNYWKRRQRRSTWTHFDTCCLQIKPMLNNSNTALFFPPWEFSGKNLPDFISHDLIQGLNLPDKFFRQLLWNSVGSFTSVMPPRDSEVILNQDK